MVRSFDGTPIDRAWLDDICSQSLWAPTAGNSAGVRMHTFGADLVADYLALATDEQWRATSRRAPGLARAGGGVLVTSRPQDYFARYAERDKMSSGLDAQSAWPIPYWHTDAAMATMALLLLIEEAHWRATIWGNFRNDESVLAWANASEEQLFATVLIGRADGNDLTSGSLNRPVSPRAARVRRIES
ncbi:MAG TPA: nitroreductase family protein [Acidimicrobiales bacterium]|nr:nitroreductase family protein [Acidimicrobiales bacterium]